jgi:hypothetical protein
VVRVEVVTSNGEIEAVSLASGVRISIELSRGGEEVLYVLDAAGERLAGFATERLVSASTAGDARDA